MNPSWIRIAVSASAPVIDRSIPMVTALSAAKPRCGRMMPVAAAAPVKRITERRVTHVIARPPCGLLRTEAHDNLGQPSLIARQQWRQAFATWAPILGRIRANDADAERGNKRRHDDPVCRVDDRGLRSLYLPSAPISRWNASRLVHPHEHGHQRR